MRVALVPAQRIAGMVGWEDHGMAVTFDTLKAATRLREQADFSEKQATALVETFADGIVDNLATREDLKNTEHVLRSDLESTEQALRSDLEALRGDLEKTEQGLRADLEKTEQGLRADLEKSEQALRADLEKSEQALRADLEKSERALRSDLQKTEQGLRADLDRNTASLRNEMHKLENRMTLRLGGVIAAGIGIIVAVDKIF